MLLKKLFAIITALALLFCLTGCAGGEDTDENMTSVAPLAHSVNVLLHAEQGEIPEIPYKLGHDIEDIKATFMSHVESGSEISELIESEGEDDVWLLGGSVTFCYKKDKKDKGVSVIVSQDYAYDFAPGINDIDDVIFAMGDTPYERGETEAEDAFFLPGIPANSECLTYMAGEYELRFIFTDNYLSVVSLTDPENW